MNELRRTVLVNRRDVLRSNLEITGWDIRQNREAGLLRRLELPGRPAGMYLRSEVMALRGEQDDVVLDLPMKVMLTIPDVLNSNLGVTRDAVNAAVRSGALRSLILPGRTFARFRRVDVLKAFGIVENVKESGA